MLNHSGIATLTSGKWWIDGTLRALVWLCAVSWHSGRSVMAVHDGPGISSNRKSRLREPETAESQKKAKSRNICSKIFFDHSCFSAEMGHDCQKHITHLVVIWVSGISDGPLFAACCQCSGFKRWHCFTSESFHFSAHLWRLIASLFLSFFFSLVLLFRQNKRLPQTEQLSIALPNTCYAKSFIICNQTQHWRCIRT